jgi:hypothetical protein
MSVGLVMCMLWPSRAQELAGKQCQGIGDKTGRAIYISMDKPSLFLSQQVMAAVCFHTMLPQLVGPLDRHTLAGNIVINHP